MYINGAVVPNSLSAAEGLLMHEAFHELGLDDNAIGIALHSIDPTIVPDANNPNNWSDTRQFSTKFMKDCF